MKRVFGVLNVLAQELGHTFFWIGVGYVVAQVLRTWGWL